MTVDDQHREKSGRATLENEARLVGSSVVSAESSPPAEEVAPVRRIVEYDSAIARRAASFHQLAGSTFYSQDKFEPDAFLRSTNEGYIEGLTMAFETAHGHITHSFYCGRLIAAAVLTDRQELWFVHPPLDSSVAPIADLLFECDRLNTEADRVLIGSKREKDLQATKTLIYGVITKLLSILDGRTQSSPIAPSIIDLHKRELLHANDYYRRAAERFAKFDYFRGMLIGFIVCSAIVGGIGWTWVRLGFDTDTGKELIGCLIAGGIGAVVSVMSRMTFGDLSLDHEAGHHLLTLFGGVRPAIGMTLGAAMWVLSSSGILAIGPDTAAKQHFFHVLIAFLAGFSERWAQDMLGRTADEISRRKKRRKGN